MTAAFEVNEPIMRYAATKPPRKVSFQTFLKKYKDRSDGYKYEWVDGIVEKSPAMTTRELYIIKVLMELFYALKPHVEGILTCEVEQWTTSSKFRIPDLAYFTDAQIQAGRNGEEPLSDFMIELISQNDQINKVNEKVIEYFEAGVKVVWLVFPLQKMVYVYTSPTQVTICKDDTLCSADSVFKGFSIKASTIFE